MSTKKKAESNPKQGESESSSKAIAVIIILCFMGVLPILIWATLPEESPYTSVTTTSPVVQTAAADAGLQTCSSDPIAVQVPEATSAVLYTLSPSCSSLDPATTIQVLVVGFSSSEALLAAISDAQYIHRKWQVENTEAYIHGYTIMIVQGAPGNTAVQQVGASFIDENAVRIV